MTALQTRDQLASSGIAPLIPRRFDSATKPITIAILAMGGEGGGVLADWLVALAEANGYWAQTTSVPGVAQRTGATIYYLELFKKDAQHANPPVLALMPTPGEVDIVIASELMEAGRAVQRGLVSANRTTLIASTHRVYSMTERIAMGDGRVDSAALLAITQAHAKHAILADFAALATAQKSTITAVLLGALAGANALPFGHAQFEATITQAGIGVKASLAGFAHGFAQVRGESVTSQVKPLPSTATPQALRADVSALPPTLHTVAGLGVVKLTDYQDQAYARHYLARVRRMSAWPVDIAIEAARYLALWMAYEDIVRVADLKCRATRFARVADEVRLEEQQLIAVNEYFHPRAAEIADILPPALGRVLLEEGYLARFFRALLGLNRPQGRIVQSNSVRGFLQLYMVAGLRRLRPRSRRFAVEQQRIESWLTCIEAVRSQDPALAAQIVQCARLIKGYSDTHARGLANYEQIMERINASPPPTAAQLKGWIDAALVDDTGSALRTALQAGRTPL